MAISLPTSFLRIRKPETCFLASSSIQNIHFGYPKPSKNNPKTLTKVLSNPSETITIESKKEAKESVFEIANSWRKIHGEDNWVGMLDPINPELRAELIRYGEMAQACYDSFNSESYSKYCGSCRVPASQYFKELGMDNHGYVVTRYINATANQDLPNFFRKSLSSEAWSKNGNWMGYIAVSDDETSKKIGRRDIAIAWRGTITQLEWLADLRDYLEPISTDKLRSSDPKIKIETGFVDLYTDKDEICKFCKYSARQQVLSEVKRLIELYGKDEQLSITITGHSLGAALAVLSSYDLAEMGLNATETGQAIPICVFSFSGPRVGNLKFRDRIEKLGVKVLRIVNVHDVVPKSPGFFFNEKTNPWLMKLAGDLPWSYSHVGVELELDHKSSPFLRPSTDLGNAHNLEMHLHLLDGYHGRGRKFESAGGRDPALVNKSSGFLKDECLVPPTWKQDQNKGMVRTSDGRWVQPERPKILDDHLVDGFIPLKT